MLTLYVPKEEAVYEKRVALAPDSVKKFCALGMNVKIEENAGVASFFSNEAYQDAGAAIVSKNSSSHSVDLFLTVRGVETHAALGQNTHMIGMLRNSSVNINTLGIARAFDLSLLPRVSRAQSMDVLSSQSTIAGYWAVLEAARVLPRLFPLLMTAAGTIAPARVLVLGAGVAGLQAIATAKRLGAIVAALDVRKAAKEQVESLGAEFITVDGEEGEGKGGYAQEVDVSYQKRQSEKLAVVLSKIDVVIATALIPGKPAPRILTQEHLSFLKPGSVVVDLAVESGGNCEGSRFQETYVNDKGVTLIGEAFAPAHYPSNASSLYARNMFEFVKLLWDSDAQTLKPTSRDDLLSATCVYEAPQESQVFKKVATA